MKLNDFIGKVVISTETKKRYVLYQITSPAILIQEEKPNKDGHRAFYKFDTINGDPFKNGYLVFEDTSLSKPFREAYDAHCRSKDGYWEDYGYWMRKD
jgi:hypothetical protein